MYLGVRFSGIRNLTPAILKMETVELPKGKTMKCFRCLDRVTVADHETAPSNPKTETTRVGLAFERRPLTPVAAAPLPNPNSTAPGASSAHPVEAVEALSQGKRMGARRPGEEEEEEGSLHEAAAPAGTTATAPSLRSNLRRPGGSAAAARVGRPAALAALGPAAPAKALPAASGAAPRRRRRCRAVPAAAPVQADREG